MSAHFADKTQSQEIITSTVLEAIASVIFSF